MPARAASPAGELREAAYRPGGTHMAHKLLAPREPAPIVRAVPRSWTLEQTASLAPDAASLKTAQGIASPRKWDLLGRDDEFAWGLAQGSGAQPYQTQIALAEPAFKCSCPSRKFPCKHGLGLLLLLAGSPAALAAGARPAWVTEWAAKRAEKAAKQEARVTEAATAPPPDPAAQAKRREKRAANIAQGVAFLDGWLQDLVRQGFAAAGGAGYGLWDEPARRLVDAQAPGLARRVRGLGGAIGNDQAGDERALAELGRLHLLVAATQRRDTLSAEWQQEIDGQLGVAVEQDEVRRGPGVAGTWLVAAQTSADEDKLVTRTTYLFSTGRQVAKILEFHPAAQPAVSTLALGRWLEGEVAYFPGIEPLRALWKTPPRDAVGGELPLFQRCDDILAAQAARLAANPLAEALPLVAELTPQRDAGRWLLRDSEGAALPIVAGFQAGWELLACSGGAPLPLAGLWDGLAFTPLTALADGGLYQLSLRAP